MVGWVHQVPLKIGEWSREVNLIVIPLDDFDVVLRHEFMKKEKETTTSHLEILLFLARKEPIYVQTVNRLPGERKVTVLVVFTPIIAERKIDGEHCKECVRKENFA